MSMANLKSFTTNIVFFCFNFLFLSYKYMLFFYFFWSIYLPFPFFPLFSSHFPIFLPFLSLRNSFLNQPSPGSVNTKIIPLYWFTGFTYIQENIYIDIKEAKICFFVIWMYLWAVKIFWYKYSCFYNIRHVPLHG